MKKFTKILKNQKGLTLIELLAVIVILAIVAAIAVPSIGGVIENSKYKATKADAISVLNAAQLYFTDLPNETTVTLPVLKSNGYLETEGTMAKIGNTDVTVSKGTPNSITTGAIPYSGTKTITFTGATLKGINADIQKGSDSTAKTVIGKAAGE